MHDLRATAPRWSKTAVVVVLVVFGLVLVVGIFGLWAFRASRESSLQTARADALVHANTELDKIHDEIGKHMRGLLERVKNIASSRGTADAPLRPTEGLRTFLSGPLHGRSVREVFRVASDEPPPGDSVLWFRGRYRLYDKPDAIEAEATANETDPERQDELKGLQGLAWAAERKSGPLAALAHWRTITERFGLVTRRIKGGSSGRMADGVGFAAEMLKQAANALEVDPQAVSVGDARDVILRALEIESLHVERTALDEEFLAFGLTSINRELELLLSRLPEADASLLRWEVHRFRRTRGQLRPLVDNGVLLGAVDDIRNADKLGEFVVFDGLEDFDHSELLGIAIGADRECLIVRFDLPAIEEVVEERVAAHARKFHAQGMQAYLLRTAEDPKLPGGRREVAEMTLADRTFALPFRIVVDRVGNPEGHGEDFTDVMFWVVIGLAVAGLMLAGRILIRLLTREVRLAQLKADFVSNLSHELKTPITSISLFTEMLDDGKITDAEDLKEAYSVLALESSRLQGLVHRMIDVARGEARKTPYELVPADLNRPVLEAATRLQRIVTEPGLDLTIQLHPAPLPMLMDPSSMDDVVTNLLSNAWKYKQGDNAKVHVRTARRGRYAILEVSDDGVGIPKGERRRVFEMFYRADQYLTHPVAGTGLGLALVRSVVLGHRGKIRVESGPGGVGTSFRLRFPLSRAFAAQFEGQRDGGDATGIDDSDIHVGDPSDYDDHEAQMAGPHGKVSPSGSDGRHDRDPSDREFETGAHYPGAQS
jgi:signal transduction histidine kinase